MDMNRFSVMNRQRCNATNGFNHELSDWTLSDWMTATVGELGEAANNIKKLNRIRDNIPGNKENEQEKDLKTKLARELADTFIYLDLLAQAAGISLSQVVPATFNQKSNQIGYSEVIL